MELKKPLKTDDLLEDLLLKKVTIYDNWETIRQRFNENYPLFFIEFIKKGIQLTTPEEQLLILEKIGLNIKNIAMLLKVLPESVHKRRYRLNKKIKALHN